MYPQINLGFIQFSSYAFFTVAALVAAVTGMYFFALIRGFKRTDVLWMLGGMSFAVFAGARLFNAFVNPGWYFENPGRLVAFSATGFSLFGGIFMALLAGYLISIWRKIPLFKFADTTTPFIGIGIALMRIGCFLNGCCFGKETDLPWGVKFPMLSEPHLHQIQNDLIGSMTVHPVHPTQLYELAAALIGTVTAFILIKRGKPDGTAFLVCGMYFSAFRWFNMQLRVLPYSGEMLNIWYPLIYAGVIVICALLLIKFNLKKRAGILIANRSQ